MKKSKKSNKLILLAAVLLALIAAPALAQDGGDGGGGSGALDLAALGACIGIGIAAAGVGIGQGRATSEACAGIARNPGAGGRIQILLLIGLAFMESVVIYALVIALRGVGFIGG